MEEDDLRKEIGNKEDKSTLNKNNKKKENSFDKLRKIQKLLKKESALKELCKLIKYF